MALRTALAYFLSKEIKELEEEEEKHEVSLIQILQTPTIT